MFSQFVRHLPFLTIIIWFQASEVIKLDQTMEGIMLPSHHDSY